MRCKEASLLLEQGAEFATTSVPPLLTCPAMRDGAYPHLLAPRLFGAHDTSNPHWTGSTYHDGQRSVVPGSVCLVVEEPNTLQFGEHKHLPCGFVCVYVCVCVCVCVCMCVSVCVCVCMYAHRSIHRQRPCRFVAGIGGFYDVGSMHSTDFGLGWEQVNLVVVRWGSRFKVRDHLLDTRFGRHSPPVPHLLQSRLGRRLQSLEVLALGLAPTHILDVGSHMAGAWDEVGFRECFGKVEASTCIPVHYHVMPKCVQRRLVRGEARVRELVRSHLAVSC